MLPRYYQLIFSALVAAACYDEIKTNAGGEEAAISAKECLKNPDYPGCREYLGEGFTVTKATPLAARPNQTITLSGENFSEGMSVEVAGSDLPLNLVGTGEATFVMPEGVQNGKVAALVKKYSYSQDFTLYALDDGEYPLITDPPSEVCQGKTYYDGNGILTDGTKDCTGTEEQVACSESGEVGCVASSSFPAIAASLLTPGNIKAGVQIGTVTGAYPSPSYPLTGADATADLPAFATTAGGTTYEWFTSDGSRLTGSIQADQSVTPGTTDQILNTGLYRSVTVVGDADLVAAKIKNGVSLFSVAGDYPSASNPLAGADATVDLDLATFDAKVKSAATFEWFDAAGTRYSNSGDADITAGNIVNGVTIFGTTGNYGISNCTGDGQTGCVTTSTYKSVDTSALSVWDIREGKSAGGIAGSLPFYKNMAKLTTFNRTAGTGSTATIDPYDSIDDSNNGGAFPTENASGWAQATGANWVRDPASDTGAGAAAGNGVCDGGENCVYLDQVSGLYWAQDNASSYNWDNGITYCGSTLNTASYGGYSDWRMPTQKETMQAYTNGIWAKASASEMNMSATYYWAATTLGGSPSIAWRITFNSGIVGYTAKTTSHRVLCVR